MKKNRTAAVDVDLIELVEGAQRGEKQAINGLVEATQNRLFRFCLTLTGDRVLAEDLCQEAFLKTLTRLSSLEKSSAFIDWLFQVTKNLYLDHVRSRSSREIALDPDVLEKEIGSNGDLAEILSIQASLSQFEPEDRLLLLLVDLEERSYKEAGEILGISEDAVRSRLFRVRKLFLQNWEGPATKRRR